MAVVISIVGATFALLAPVGPSPAGAAPQNLAMTTFGAIAVDPVSGRVFVAGDDKVVAFTPAGAPLGTINQVYGARGLSFDGGYLWATQTTAGSIAKINPSTLTKVGEFATGGPVGAGIGTVGGLVWFTNPNGGTTAGLRALDPVSGTVTNRGRHLGPQIAEIPGRDDRLLLGDAVTLVDTTTNPVTVLGAGGSGDNFRQAAATEVGTFVSASGAPYRFDEYSLTPRNGTLGRTGVTYPGRHYPNGVAYSSALGGVIAGTTQSSQRLFVARRGKAATTHELPIGGEPIPRGIALSNDARVAYSVNSLSGYGGPAHLTTISLTPALLGTDIPPVTRGVASEGTVTGTAMGSISSATLGGVPVEIAHDGPDRLELDITTSLAPGLHPLVLTGPWGNLSTTVSVVANVGGTLSGLITKGGAPVPDAVVSLTGESGSRATTTGPDGRYHIADLPYGRHDDLVVSDPVGGTTLTFPDLDLRSGAPWTRDVDLLDPPDRDLQVRSTDLPPGDVRRLVVDPATGRAFVAVGDEVVAFDRDGRRLGRIREQWGASDLQVVGSKLYVMQARGGAVTELDTTTLSVLRTLPLGRATTGALTVTGHRLRFVDGDDQWTALASLDLTTGAVTATPTGSLYEPQVAPIDGTSTRFLSWEEGISSSDVTHWDASALVPTMVATTEFSLYGSQPGQVVASLPAGKAWSADGRELALSTMTLTGVTYPSGGGQAVARSSAHGGVLVFGTRVVRQGAPSATHILPAVAARRSIGMSAGGDRTYTATEDGRLVVADLAPIVRSISPDLVVELPANIVISGVGLGGATAVEVDGEPVTFSIPGPDDLNVSLAGVEDGVHDVVVRTPWGESAPRRITVDAQPGPTVTAVAPASGTALGGEVVRLTGSDLDQVTGVSFGDRPATSITVVSATAVDVVVPPHPAGEVAIAVTSAAHPTATGPTYRFLDPVGPGPLPAEVVGGGVTAQARPVSGDFDGDGVDDVFLHRPGSGPDTLRTYRGDGTYATRTLAVSGDFQPIAGDFTGDGVDDILWYAPGTAPDSLWDFNRGGTRTSTSLDIRGTYRPVSGDLTGDGVDDVLWYAPGTAADSLWDFNRGGGRTSSPRTVNGTYTPVAGDLTGDGVDDVLWYAPGTVADHLWEINAGGSHTTSTLTVSGRYRPVSGDLTGDGVDDVLWYGSGSAADALWDFNVGGGRTPRVITASMVAVPVIGDLTGGGVDDVYWHATPPRPDVTWFSTPVVS